MVTELALEWVAGTEDEGARGSTFTVGEMACAQCTCAAGALPAAAPDTIGNTEGHDRVGGQNSDMATPYDMVPSWRPVYSLLTVRTVSTRVLSIGGFPGAQRALAFSEVEAARPSGRPLLPCVGVPLESPGW